VLFSFRLRFLCDPYSTVVSSCLVISKLEFDGTDIDTDNDTDIRDAPIV